MVTLKIHRGNPRYDKRGSCDCCKTLPTPRVADITGGRRHTGLASGGVGSADVSMLKVSLIGRNSRGQGCGFSALDTFVTTETNTIACHG